MGIYSSDPPIPCLNINGRVITDIGDIFNVTGSELAEGSDIRAYSAKFVRFKHCAEPQKLRFDPVQTSRCLRQARLLAPGPDNISYSMLNHLS